VLLSKFSPWFRSCFAHSSHHIRTWHLQFALKLIRFCKPAFIGLKFVVGCTMQAFTRQYLNSISQVSHKPVFLGLNYQFRLHHTLNGKHQLNYTSSVLAITSISSKSRMPDHLFKDNFGIHDAYDALFKDFHANCFCASLLRTQIHMPHHAWARTK